MNCAKIQELLPLYAGHDLARAREQLVAAHLQSCAPCSLALDEYREVREQMRDFAPPVFSDEVFSEIRNNVWERIESQPRTQSLFESVAVWFQPRLVWAAAALLITISTVGLYLVFKESAVRPTVVVDVPEWDIGPPHETVI